MTDPQLDAALDSVGDEAALMIPIGHCIGAYYDLPVSDAHFFQVRVGPDVVRLDDQQFAVWCLAHGTPMRHVDLPWNRRNLLAAARAAGLHGAEQVLDGLIADRMVCVTTAQTDSAVDFARRHRMVPLMLGLGNTAAEPRLYAVGLHHQPVVEMSAIAYDLYEWAHMDANLWLACQGAAATATRVGIEDRLATDPLLMLNALLGTVHCLLTPNAIYFDTRRAA